MSKRNNKLSIPVIEVAKGDQALATGTLTSATSALNIASGQLGVLSWDFSGTKPLGTFIAATDDATEVKAIKILCGTPVSAATQNADIWEVGDKAYVESGVIRNDKIRSVSVSKARFPKWGGFAATSFPTPADDVEYKAYVRLLSVRSDRDFGNNDDVIEVSFPATDFTTLGTVSPKDLVLKTIVDKLNRYSRIVNQNGNQAKGNKNIVAFAVKIAGGTGTVIGTIVPGTVVPFQTIDGVTTSVTADEAMVRALAQLVNDNATLVGTSTILNVNLATAGAAADADAIIVLGLPSLTAAYSDNIEQVQTSAEISFGGGWVTGSTPVVTKMWADEGTGQASKWAIASADRYLLTVHTAQSHPWGEYFATGKDYIDSTKLYTSYQIDFYDTENPLGGLEITSPKSVTLLFPSEKLSSFTASVNNVVTRLAAGNTPITMTTSNDAGTGTASAVTVASVNTILGQWLESARTNYGFTDGLFGEAVVGGPYLS